MKKKKRIALALAAALMMVLLLAACSDKTIRLGVAGIGGVYQVFGEDYAALQAQNGGRKLEVRETAGSAASLRLLSSGYLQMAVVQADMAQDAYNQTGAFAESEVENNFSTVAVLYQEECHIVVRADSGINTVEKLAALDGQVFLDEDDDVYCVWRGEFDEESNICSYGMDLFQRRGETWIRSFEEHREYAYSQEQLTAYLKAAGFTHIAVYADRRFEAPGAGEQRVYVKARKGKIK